MLHILRLGCWFMRKWTTSIVWMLSGKIRACVYRPDIVFMKSLEPCHEKTCFCHMRTTKAQISLRIRAVWSAPLLFSSTCWIQNFKALACVCGWAGWWVLPGRKPRRQVSSWRGSLVNDMEGDERCPYLENMTKQSTTSHLLWRKSGNRHFQQSLAYKL